MDANSKVYYYIMAKVDGACRSKLVLMKQDNFERRQIDFLESICRYNKVSF